MARITALSKPLQTLSVEAATSSPPSSPPTVSVEPVERAQSSLWFVADDPSGLAVVRKVPCVVCCPRKRPRCPVCMGTGIREARYEISLEDAATLRDELTAMLLRR